MTTLQKAIIGAVLAAAVGVDVYEVRLTSRLREQVQTLRQQQAPVAAQAQQLTRERDGVSNRLSQAAAAAAGKTYRWEVVESPDYRQYIANLRADQSDSANLTTVAFTALFLLKSGQVAEARDLANRAPNYPLSYYVLASAGERVAVLDRLRLLEQVRPAPSLVETNHALAWLGFGDTLRALDALERATATMEIWPSMHGGTGDPVFAPIRGSPRFRAVVGSLGLPARRPGSGG